MVVVKRLGATAVVGHAAVAVAERMAIVIVGGGRAAATCFGANEYQFAEVAAACPGRWEEVVCSWSLSE